MNKQRKPNQAGKAEFGLLVALLMFLGAVGGAVWMVAKSYRAPSTVPVDRPSKQAGPKKINEVDDLLPGRGTKRAVTIVADPKTITALDNLRKTVEQEAVPKPKKLEAPPASSAVKAASYAEELAVDRRALTSDAPEVQFALEHLQKYRAAKTWQEKLPLVYQPTDTQSLMERFYGSQGLKDPDLGEFMSASDLRVGKRKVISLTFRCSGRLNMTAHINFHRAPSGLLLDWESMVGFSNRSFGEFRSEKSARPTIFRVLAAADDYYNFEFADVKKYLSLKLYSPDGDDYLNSFCERESPTGKKLVEIIGNASNERAISSSLSGSRGGSFPVTLELAFPEHAQSDRCVRIERFIDAWWLALESDKNATASIKDSPPAAQK